MSAPLKKRRISTSTSPVDERRVSINEPLKKIKQENINNNVVSPGGNNNNNTNLKSEPFSPKMSQQQQQQSKASGSGGSGSSLFTTRQIGTTGSNITHSFGQTINTISNPLPVSLSSPVLIDNIESLTSSTTSTSKGKGNSNSSSNSISTGIHAQQSASTFAPASASSSQQDRYQQQPIQETQQLSSQELMIRLTKKEEEIQNLLGELQNLSQTLTPDFTFDQSLRKKFLDPAINALFRTMKKELEDKDKMIENLQSELDGVKFTTNSITGQKLVAKLKALQEENEELGRQLRQGRVEQYEVEIAMQRKLINELKHGVEEYESKIIAFDSETEHLQDLIFQIQSKLKQYQNKYGPLVPENNKEKENVSKIATTATNNNISKSDIVAVTEETKRDVHSQRMDEG
ncbi:hypothetical protein Glove_120g75 [Diversispora epigaea]|uniref:Uncharacterized protein n=1 Tax=Diversispora epigaea TaxID=1348612 RepID=A0A397IZE1_9GLOM|nr:hypothetical protein Glove_120g75 [Diversispora epigaea]